MRLEEEAQRSKKYLDPSSFDKVIRFFMAFLLPVQPTIYASFNHYPLIHPIRSLFEYSYFLIQTAEEGVRYSSNRET